MKSEVERPWVGIYWVRACVRSIGRYFGAERTTAMGRSSDAEIPGVGRARWLSSAILGLAQLPAGALMWWWGHPGVGAASAGSGLVLITGCVAAVFWIKPS